MRLPFIPEVSIVVNYAAVARRRKWHERWPVAAVALARASLCFGVTVLPVLLAWAASVRFGFAAGLAASGAVAFGWLLALAYRATRRERRVVPVKSIRRVA